MMASTTAIIERIKGEPRLVIRSIMVVKNGVRKCTRAVSTALLKGVSSPLPLVTPAVTTIRANPENTATKRNKIFFITRVMFT